MAMENKGFVTEVSGDIVKVRVVRESACGGNCAGCHGCPTDAVIVECKINNDTLFNVGDEVIVTMSRKSFFQGVFVCYGLMTILMILGAVAGYSIWRSEIASVLGGFLGLAVGGIFMKIISVRKEIGVKISKIELI